MNGLHLATVLLCTPCTRIQLQADHVPWTRLPLHSVSTAYQDTVPAAVLSKMLTPKRCRILKQLYSPRCTSTPIQELYTATLKQKTWKIGEGETTLPAKHL